MDDEEELRFSRWKNHILKYTGDKNEDILRYCWNLFSTLLEGIEDLKQELKQLKQQIQTFNYLKNGKDEGQTPN